MAAPAAKLRFPHGRVLLARTKLAYVNLRNLIGDAKRDRTARVAGYVQIWLPDDLIVLFLREGEVRTAASVTANGAEAIPIGEALARVPAEPEFGEICFHEAAPELLACIYRALLAPDTPWPPGLSAADPRVLFPHLRDTKFSGVVEVVSRDATNYLLLRDGLIEQIYLADDDGSGRTEQLNRLFGAPPTRSRARVRGWPGPVALPTQAPPALVGAYRELVTRLYAELAAAGVTAAPAIGERARETLVERHPSLRSFADGGSPVNDPAEEEDEVTSAVAAWVTETVREALEGDDAAATRVLTAAARDRRHMLNAAGFLSSLPWDLRW